MTMSRAGAPNPTLALAAAAACAAPLAGCGDDGPEDPFARSCAGAPLVEASCAVPYGWSEVVAARFEPANLGVDDFETPARVRVELRTCDPADIPRPHRVRIVAVLEPDGLPVDPLDAGTPGGRDVAVATIEDDGAGIDETPRDGVVEAELTPPVFDSDLAFAPNREIVLRFQSGIRSVTPPRELDCAGPVFELPYETGPLVDRP